MLQLLASGLLLATVGAIPLGGRPVTDLEGLQGTWTGLTANPGGTPYPVQLTINTTTWSEWGVIGRVTYPLQGLEAPVQIFYGMDCKLPTFDGEVTLAGENPIDRCFTVLENFEDPTAVGLPGSIFNRGFLSLSLQSTGTLYYNYLNGVASVARSYLQRSNRQGGASLQETLPPKHEEEIAAANTFDGFNFGGQWDGSVAHNSVQLSTPIMKSWGLGVDAASSVHSIGFALNDDCIPGEFCGKIELPNQEDVLSPFSRNVQFLARLPCTMETFPDLMGPDPAFDSSPIVGGFYRGFCYQMVAFLANTDYSDIDAMWFTLTLQNDGSLAYAMQQGPLGNAAGIIERTGDLPKRNMCKDVDAFLPDALTPPDEAGEQFRCADTQTYLDSFGQANCADPEYFFIVEGLSACCGGGFTVCENFCLDNSAFQPEATYEFDGEVLPCSYAQDYVDLFFPLNREDACADPEFLQNSFLVAPSCCNGPSICE